MSATRQALYARLVDVLGVDHALTLMHYLPDDHPATRTDLGELRGEVRDLRSGMHDEIRGLREELRTEIRALHELFAGQTRTIVMTSFGSALTVATLVFIAAQIV
jgi:hypothetical protein